MNTPQSTTLFPTLITGKYNKEEEVRFVMDFVDRSAEKRQEYMSLWDEMLSNYLVMPSTMKQGVFRWKGQINRIGAAIAERGYSILKDPETHQIVDSLTSQALGLLLGERDYISAVPIGQDDYEKSRLISKLLMAQLEQEDVYRTHHELFKSAFLFGTSVISIGWETRSRIQMTKQMSLDPRTMLPSMSMTPQEVVYRDRPLQRFVPLWNFFPDPNGTRIQQDMLGVAEEFEVDFDTAISLAESGVWDKQSVVRAIDKASKSSRNTEGPWGPPSTAYRMLGGYEFWGRSPLSQHRGASNRVMTVLEGECVRSAINGYLDGNIPYKEINPNPVPGRFYGLGVAEVIRFLQDSADSLLMNLTDAADLAVRTPIMVGQMWGGDPDRLKARKLGDILQVRDVKQVGEVPMNLSALGFATQELLRRKISMREGSGVTNPMQAISSGDRATATEVSELSRFATQKVESMVMLLERDAYPWIGRTLHSRNRQFLPPGGAVATLLGEQFEVPLEVVDVEVDVRFVGSRTAQSRLQKVASYREGINVLASSLPLLPIMPEMFVRYLRDGLDIPDGERIVADAVLRQAMTVQPGPTGPEGSQQQQGSKGEENFGTAAGQTERQGQMVH